MMELWPFTNFHDLNLDWIISVWKKVEKYLEKITEYMQRAETAADDSEHAAEIAEAAKNEILSRYHATPQAYGAVGDGVTDDTAAIQDMFDDTGAPVYFPEGVYLISQPIIDDDPDRDVYMEGEIKYTGPAVGLTLKDKYNCYLVINTDSGLSTYVPNSTGAKLENCNSCTIIVKKANSYEKGVVLEGANAGFAYNKIWVMDVINNLDGVTAQATGTGWFNENQFYGGRCDVFSTSPYVANATGFKLLGTSTHNANNNTFYNPSFENIGVGFKVDYARFNSFNNFRSENVTDAIQETNSNCNAYSITYKSGGNPASVSTLSMLKLQAQVTMDDNFSYVDDISIVGSVRSTGTYASVPHMLGSSTSGGVYHTFFNVIGKTGPNNGLLLSGNAWAGTMFNCAGNEIIHFAPKYLSGEGRATVCFFDENDNPISTGLESPKTYPAGAPAGWQPTTQGTHVAGTQETQANIGREGIYIKVPTGTRKILIGIRTQGSGAANNIELAGFTVRSDKPTLVNIANAEPVLNGTPTESADTGALCVANNGVYRYTGSAWVQV